MPKKFNGKIFLQLITAGILFGLSFPPVNFYFLIFISFAYLINLTVKSKSIGSLFINVYFLFFCACITSVSWISLSGFGENADSFLILAGMFVLIVYPLFFVFPVILYYFILKFPIRNFSVVFLFSFPFIWTSSEYLLSLGQISFPWLFAGNSQSYNLEKIQFAEFTGVFGVSFWICLMSVLVYQFYKNQKHVKLFALNIKSLILLLLIFTMYFLPDIYTYFSEANKKFSGNKFDSKIKIAIIQPNIDPWKKWGGKQSELIESYLSDIKNIAESEINLELIILPETALPYYFRESIFEENYQKIKMLCDSLKIPVLIGTPDLNYYENESQAPPDAKIMKISKKKYDTYNSAFLFEPLKDKNSYQKHYKIKLVIGSERMPYQELFPFSKSLVEWGVGLSSWQIGKDTNVFKLENESRFNTAICYESVYPGFFADFVNKGADFSVIITNDGWWGKLAGTYQHNRFAVFRAIENRRWIARCANTGISCFIDAYGNYYDETVINEKQNISMSIGMNKLKTYYTGHGDVFSLYCTIISAAFLIAAFGKRMFTSRD